MRGDEPGREEEEENLSRAGSQVIGAVMAACIGQVHAVRGGRNRNPERNASDGRLPRLVWSTVWVWGMMDG